ncbi:hypothetical protein [Candidatus Poriferisocius sp.]|uniref:hypothetical protein n=1 Tax=Candidatus Poriferisocius sp. TaxID=3101276 RepID=UPI003B52664E
MDRSLKRGLIVIGLFVVFLALGFFLGYRVRDNQGKVVLAEAEDRIGVLEMERLSLLARSDSLDLALSRLAALSEESRERVRTIRVPVMRDTAFFAPIDTITDPVVLAIVDTLRIDNAQLRAAVVARDEHIANLEVELGLLQGKVDSQERELYLTMQINEQLRTQIAQLRNPPWYKRQRTGVVGTAAALIGLDAWLASRKK